MTAFEDFLSSKEPDEVSAEKLRYIGKKAASNFVENKTPLNDALADLSKEASLNYEQIKRVVEFANNETFSQLFKLGYDKNVTFEMASAPQVAQKNSPDKTKVASFVEPAKVKYVPGQESASVEDIFTKTANVGKVKTLMARGMSLEEAVKAAYPDYTPEQTKQFMEMYKGRLEKSASAEVSISEKSREFLDLSREKDRLESDLVCLGDEFTVKLASLEGLCKEASNSGNPPAVIASAIMAGAPSKGLVDVIKDKVGDLADFDSGTKLAFGGMIAPGNPVTGLVTDLENTSSKLVATMGAVQRAQMGMTELLSIIKGPAPMGAASLFGQGGMAVPAGPPQAAPPMMGGPAPEAPPLGGAPVSGMPPQA